MSAAGAEEGGDYQRPQDWKQWLVFVFRELFRSDFCFIVLMLALLDAMWILLPAAALGAQAYWIILFTESTPNYYVRPPE